MTREEMRDEVANIIAKGRRDECITLDIAERVIVYLHSKGEPLIDAVSSPPTFRDGSTLAFADVMLQEATL